MAKQLKNKVTMTKPDQSEYLKKWKVDNAVYLATTFGVKDGPPVSFLTGILFATSCSKHMVPLLEDVIQADGAHTSYGKYTLFTAYATSANGNMVLVAGAILFGNEDKANWFTFWTFLKKNHPSLSCRKKTILTDQDKGSIAAVSSIMNAWQFHCVFHRRQNIVKERGGGKGTTPLSALWVFNLIFAADTVEAIAALKARYFDSMDRGDVAYLNRLEDERQYPAARCAMGDDICMNSHRASQGVEAMNFSNNPARVRTAVDILNATLLIVALEEKRYERYKASAWARMEQLTQRGMLIMENVFKDVDIRSFELEVRQNGNCHCCTVKSNLKPSSKKFDVIIPIQEDRFGSRFGTCTCGKPAKEGAPCQHMVVVAKSTRIEGLTRIDIIPGYLTTACWKEQFAQDVHCSTTSASMSDIKLNYTPDDKLRCMPAVLAPNKSGRPKNNSRKKGIIDHIAESAKKRKRKKKLYCAKCNKFNHNTVNCWNNNSNSKRQKKSGSNSNNHQQDDDEDEEIRIVAEQAGI